jgi:hypothetical protein
MWGAVVRAAVAVVMVCSSGCLTKGNPYWGSDGADTASVPAGDDTSATGDDAISTGDETSAGASGDPSSTGSAPDPDDTSAGGSTGADTTSTWCPGELRLQHGFEQQPETNDEWTIGGRGPCTADSLDDELNVSIDLPANGEGYWWMTTSEPVAARGTVGIELVAAPSETYPAEALIGINDDRWLLHCYVAEGSLGLAWWDYFFGDYEYLDDRPYDPKQDRWLRVRFDADADEAVCETSSDAIDWTPLGTADTSRLAFPAVVGQVSAGAWWGPLSETSLARIDNAFLCDEE